MTNILLISVITALFFLSEGLASVPSIKANSIFQLLFNIITFLYQTVTGKIAKLV